MNLNHPTLHSMKKLTQIIINKIKFESGSFPSLHTIALHCEIHIEKYLNEKHSQFMQ